MNREAQIIRDTKETNIKLSLNIDGTGLYNCNTGSGFLDHMLSLFSRHGRFDLEVSCKGDTDVDFHHTTEDIGIALGMAFCKGIGDKRGIKRYGSCILPMDEVLCLCAVDICGRSNLVFDADMPAEKVGCYDTELIKEFFAALCGNMGLTLHIKLLSSGNAHHVIEAMFKGVARALAEAVSIDPDHPGEILSTKGVL